MTQAPAPGFLWAAGKKLQLSPKRVQAKPSPASPTAAPVTAPPPFPWHPGERPPASGIQERATGGMLPLTCAASQVCYSPRGTRGARLPAGGVGGPRKGARAACGASSRLPRPAHSCSLGSRAVGPHPESPAEARPLCLGSGLSLEPISPEENKEPRPRRPNLLLSPHAPVHHLPKDAFVCSGSRGLPGMPTPWPKVPLV